MPLERSYRAVSRCWLRELSPQGQEWAPRFSERALRLHCTSQGRVECSRPNSATSTLWSFTLIEACFPANVCSYVLTLSRPGTCIPTPADHTVPTSSIWPLSLAPVFKGVNSGIYAATLIGFSLLHSQVYKCYKVYKLLY